MCYFIKLLLIAISIISALLLLLKQEFQTSERKHCQNDLLGVQKKREHYYVINITNTEHEFDGHGGLSAGGSSRLLIDYPEPYRSNILDYLFKPNFGASLGVLKVEIGGDTQSTCGTEPSHMHSSRNKDCQNGYEGWLVREARLRNPNIKIWSLSWGIPGWVGNGTYYSDENINYQIAWLKCLRDEYNVDSDYIGLWNERPQGNVDYVIKLRKALDVHGFHNVGITIEATWQRLVNNVLANKEFNISIAAVSKHYPCNESSDVAMKSNKKFWSGEDTPTPYNNWTAASCWGRKLNQHYLKMYATSVISWAVVWSAFEDVSGPVAVPMKEQQQVSTDENGASAHLHHQFEGNAFMIANEPWSGHYKVPPTIWINAHWGQFVNPGWRYLKVDDASNSSSSSSSSNNNNNANHNVGGSAFLSGGGSYVTLVPPPVRTKAITTTDYYPPHTFTMIIETLQGSCGTQGHCNVATFTDTKNLTFEFRGQLFANRSIGVNMWCSNRTNMFVKQPLRMVDSIINVTVKPDTICTVTTLDNGTKGRHQKSPPPSKPFPTRYKDDFTLTSNGKQPLYFSDVYGSFEVRNGSLTQVATSHPTGWAPINLDPLTLIGDGNWMANNDTGVLVGVDAFVNAANVPYGYVRVCPMGCGDTSRHRIMFGCDVGCCFNITQNGYWSAGPNTHGHLDHFVDDRWHRIIVKINNSGSMTASVDGRSIVTTANGSCPLRLGLGMTGLGCGSYHMCAFRNFSMIKVNHDGFIGSQLNKDLSRGTISI